MARQQKAGLDYFPLDVALDTKFQLIEAEFGVTGFAIVVKLYQRIYGEQGYYCEWDTEVALLFARSIGLQTGGNVVSEVVNSAVKRGIFDENIFKKFGVLTSRGIQERYLECTQRRKKIFLEHRYLLLSAPILRENVYINSLNVDINEENVYISTQSKVNKSKVNKTKVVVGQTTFKPPTLDEVISYCNERNSNVDAEKFFDYYNKTNWCKVYGDKATPITDWKERVRAWEQGNAQTAKPKTQSNIPKYEATEDSL